MSEHTEFVRAHDLLPGVLADTFGYDITGSPVGVHRGLPSTSLTFIVSLDDPIVTADSPAELGTAAARHTSIITGGLHTAPAYIHQPAAQAGIQMSVHPLAARRLFGAPAATLTPVVDGRDVLGVEAERLRQRLLEMPDWPMRFTALRAFLVKRMDAGSGAGPRPEVAGAWAWMARHRGLGSVEGLSRHVLLSPRQLHTVFTREIGLSPKAVNRLMRFQRAVGDVTAAVRAGTSVDLGRVAADVGYADQSHLNRDFRQYTEQSPGAWLADERRNIQAGGHTVVDD